MIGETIGHYRIVAELGRGGMGVVYKAEDTKLRRTVALKFLSPHLLADPQQKARFIHEAQAAAVLDHPNISTIHEVHEADGQTFIVMAFIEGEDVQTKIGSGPMSIDEALDIAVQVAKGLTKAHGEGIVHRDIKPGNVIITREGQAKVVDFGLAKLATQTQLTKSGMMVGTVRYMSPEQAMGGKVDHRTDIWSLGVMLYEMLSGNLPFRGEVDQAIMYSVLNEDPKPVTETRKDVPVALEDIIEKALAKDPQKRYATMDEFLVDLETQRDKIVLGIKERQFTGLRKLRRRKRLTAGIATVLVVAIAAILAQTFYPIGGEDVLDTIAVLPMVNLSGDPEEDYLAEGMTRELISELTKIAALQVRPHQSVMRYQETDLTIPEIARELGVAAIVMASVVSSGNQLHINAQLIDASENKNLWADSFDRQMHNIVGLYGEMARTIAAAVHVVVAPAEAARLANKKQVDPEAYRLYLLGERFAYKLLEEGIHQGIEFCMRAIEIDSTYAPAYAALAKHYFLLTNGAMMHPLEARPLAEAAARKALELDSDLGAAHAASAVVELAFDWDFDGAEEGFRRAGALNPGDESIKEFYSFALALDGRIDEAIAITRRQTENDPLSIFPSGALGYYYWHAGRLDEAIDQLNRTVEMAPEYSYLYMHLSWCYADKGMKEETIANIERALSAAPSNQVVLGTSANAYARVGMEEEARRILVQLQQQSQTDYVDPFYIAIIHVALGEHDRAFELLRECIEVRSMSTLFIKHFRWTEPLRSDPRFQEILELAFGSSP